MLSINTAVRYVNLLAAVSGSGLWVSCASSAERNVSLAVFSARTGVAAALVSGVSKVDGVEPTAVQTTVVTENCPQEYYTITKQQPINSPLFRTTWVRQYQKNSLTLSLLLLYNIFHQLSPFSLVHNIFLTYLSSPTIFSITSLPSFLWPVSRS